MTKPNSRAVIAAVLLLGALGAVAAETAVRSAEAAERRNPVTFITAGDLATHRLVGLGCGPEHLTMTAVNEDDFPPPCHVVDTPQRLCGITDASACADYLGEGY